MIDYSFQTSEFSTPEFDMEIHSEPVAIDFSMALAEVELSN